MMTTQANRKTPPVTLNVKNIELDLWSELEMKMKGGGSSAVVVHSWEDDECGTSVAEPALSIDKRFASVSAAATFAVTHDVESWNAKNTSTGDVTHKLDRAGCVQLWRKTNTKGGCFVMKRLNFVAGASVCYSMKSEDSDGYKAWARLTTRYNRRTLARLVRVHREVMYPGEVKDMKKLIEELLR